MACILALDQGTTSSRAIVFDGEGRTVSTAQQEYTQHFPRPGWVEHDPRDIWNTQIDVAREAIRQAGLAARDVAAIGITNQRETTVVWDRVTGEPVLNAIVWQDRRTADRCDALRREGLEDTIRRKTGLVIDPYFSATKLEWILDHVDGARHRAEPGSLCFGTVDSWLVWNLTGGEVHATDATNASRTMLFDLRTGDWDADLLDLFRIPRAMLPQVCPSIGVYGETTLLGRRIPVSGIAGDQQAALFGQMGTRPGVVKNTYGTGCFLLMHTGTEPVESAHRLVTTVALQSDRGLEYALEGSVFTGGAVVQWLR
ncbi:MAG TPA: glycerol kinase GlpK, partial [Rhodothermales bacterium]